MVGFPIGFHLSTQKKGCHFEKPWPGASQLYVSIWPPGAAVMSHMLHGNMPGGRQHVIWDLEPLYALSLFICLIGHNKFTYVSKCK